MLSVLLIIISIGEPFWGANIKDILPSYLLDKQIVINFDDRGCLEEGSPVISQGKIIGEVSSISANKETKIATFITLNAGVFLDPITENTFAVISCPMLLNSPKKQVGVVELLIPEQQFNKKSVDTIVGFSSYAKLWNNSNS